ncbi:hypothetical protein BG55_17675 [Erwinia mallotivora]|uniref:Uncharacterized protein n=1 Tax=Erwinia mallotivora TaxID=69222 RepID=A0A014N4M2_9GAMM|nr:hypothetical protein BG55_17675 [Erwinia mallotivora]
MNNLTGDNRAGGVSNRQAVFHHPFAIGQWSESEFVPAFHRLLQANRQAIHRQRFTFLQRAERHGNVVFRMNFNKTRHSLLLS